MEPKKNPNADVYNRKSTNLLIGLNAALILVLGLFYYSNPPENIKIRKKNVSNEELELIPPTEQEPPKTPPPPPSPDIQEIDDDSEVEETEVDATDVTEKTTLTVPAIVPSKGPEGPAIEIDNTIYKDVDVEGTYPGGEEKLGEFVRTYYKMPRVSQELGINGVIHIQFVVEKDGTISGITAIAPKERQLGYGLEEECMRVIQLTSGKWKPASRAGKAVRSYWRYPFEIDNSSGF
jgi:protein TonB